MAGYPIGPDECGSVDGHSGRCVGCLLNTSEDSNIPQGKHIRAPKHYSESQGVWGGPKVNIPQNS